MPEACWQLKAAVGQQEKSWGGNTGWGMENVKQEGGKTDFKACSRKSI